MSEPRCDHQAVVENEQETICEQCGLVLDESPIDHGPEWRDFNDRDDQPRASPVDSTRHDNGLHTEIGWDKVGGEKKRRMGRLREQQRRTIIQSTQERNQVAGLAEIDRLTTSLGVDVSETASQLLKQAHAADIIQGRSVVGFAAACVYAACRIHEFPRTRDEIVSVAKATAAHLDFSYDALQRELGIPVPAPHPADLVATFASDLSVPAHLETKARALAADAVESGATAGYKPQGVAGACLYEAVGGAITQREIAETVGVSPDTIRNAQDCLP